MSNTNTNYTTTVNAQGGIEISNEATHYLYIKVIDANFNPVNDIIIGEITPPNGIDLDITLKKASDFILLFFIKQIPDMNEIQVTNGYVKKYRADFEPLDNYNSIFAIINDHNIPANGEIADLNNIQLGTKDDRIKKKNEESIDEIRKLIANIETKIPKSDQLKKPPRKNNMIDNSSFLNRIIALVKTKLSAISLNYKTYVSKNEYVKVTEDEIKKLCNDFIGLIGKIHENIAKSSKYNAQLKETTSQTISDIFKQHLSDDKVVTLINNILFPELEDDQYKVLSKLLNTSQDTVYNILSTFIMNNIDDINTDKHALYEKESILELIDNLISSFYKLVNYFEEHSDLLLNKDPNNRENFHYRLLEFTNEIHALHQEILVRIHEFKIVDPVGQTEIDDKFKEVIAHIKGEIKRINEKHKSFSKTHQLQSEQAYNIGNVLDLDLTTQVPLNTIELTNPSYLNYSHAISIMHSMHNMYHFMVKSINYHNTLKGYTIESENLSKDLFDDKTMNLVGFNAHLKPQSEEINPSTGEITEKEPIYEIIKKDKRDIRFLNFYYIVKHFIKLINIIRYNPIIYKLNALNSTDFNLLFMNINVDIDKNQESYIYVYDSNYKESNDMNDNNLYGFKDNNPNFLNAKNVNRSQSNKNILNIPEDVRDNDYRTDNKTYNFEPATHQVYKQNKQTGGNIYGYTDTQLNQLKNKYLDFVFIDKDIVRRFFDDFKKIPNNTQTRLLNDINDLIKDPYATNVFNERVFNIKLNKSLYEVMDIPSNIKKDKIVEKINIFTLLNIIFDNEEYFNMELSGFFLKVRFFRRLFLDVTEKFIYIKELIRCFEFQEPKFIQRIDNMIVKQNSNNILTYIKIRNNEHKDYNRRFEIYFNKIIKTSEFSHINDQNMYIDKNTRFFDSMIIKYNDDDYSYYTNQFNTEGKEIFLIHDDIAKNNMNNDPDQFLNKIVKNALLKNIGQFPPPLFNSFTSKYSRHSSTTNIKINNYDHTYNFGKFTRIFYPELSNAVVANNIPEITEKLLQGNPVFMLGYGASGAGKTSTLIYFNKQKENGILIELCRILAAKGYTKLSVSTDEVYDTYHFKETTQRTDPTVIRSPCNGDGIELSFKLDEKQITEYTDKRKRKILVSDNEIFNLKEFRLDSDYNHSNIHLYRTDKEKSNPNMDLNELVKDKIESKILSINNLVAKGITSHLNKNIKTFPKNTNLGELVTFLVDTDRLVKATTNNPNSSRSHTLVYLKFELVECHAVGDKTEETNPEYIGDDPASKIIDMVTKTVGKPFYMRKLPKELNLIIGDFAGVENEFTCEKLNTVLNFANIKDEKEAYKSYYGNSAIPSHDGNYDDGEGGNECKNYKEKGPSDTEKEDFNCDPDTRKENWIGGQMIHLGRPITEVVRLHKSIFGQKGLDVRLLSLIPPMNMTFSNEIKIIFHKLIKEIQNTYNSLTPNSLDLGGKFEQKQKQQKEFIDGIAEKLPIFFKKDPPHGEYFINIASKIDDAALSMIFNSIDLQIKYKNIEDYLLRDTSTYDPEKPSTLLTFYDFSYMNKDPKVVELFNEFLTVLLDNTPPVSGIKKEYINDKLLEFNKQKCNIIDNIKTSFKTIPSTPLTGVSSTPIQQLISSIKLCEDKLDLNKGNKKDTYNLIVKHIIYYIYSKRILGSSYKYYMENSDFLTKWNIEIKIGGSNQSKLKLLIGMKYYEVIKNVISLIYSHYIRDFQNCVIPDIDPLNPSLPRITELQRGENIVILFNKMLVYVKSPRSSEVSPLYNEITYMFADNSPFDNIKDMLKGTDSTIKSEIKNFIQRGFELVFEQLPTTVQGYDPKIFASDANFTTYLLFKCDYLQSIFSDYSDVEYEGIKRKFFTFKPEYKNFFQNLHESETIIENILRHDMNDNQLKPIFEPFNIIYKQLKKALGSQFQNTKAYHPKTPSGETNYNIKVNTWQLNAHYDGWYSTDKLNYSTVIYIIEELNKIKTFLNTGLKLEIRTYLNSILDNDYINEASTSVDNLFKLFKEVNDQNKIDIGSSYKFNVNDDSDYQNNTVIGRIFNFELETPNVTNMQILYKYRQYIDNLNQNSMSEYINKMFSIEINNIITGIHTITNNYIGVNITGQTSDEINWFIDEHESEIIKVIYNPILFMENAFFENVQKNINDKIKSKLTSRETGDTIVQNLLKAIDEKLTTDVFEKESVKQLIEMNKYILLNKTDLITGGANVKSKNKNGQKGGALAEFDRFISNYNLMHNFTGLLLNEKQRYLYIKTVCINRGMEGLFINKSLYDLKDTIQEILKVKNQGVMDMAPSIIDFYMKDYCPKYKNCFTNSNTKPNVKTIDSLLIQLIFKRVIGENLSPDLIEDFYKKIQVCVFCVVNISRDKITNNPPPSPYIDINMLKHMFYYKHEEIFYSYKIIPFKYTENENKDENSGSEINQLVVDAINAKLGMNPKDITTKVKDAIYDKITTSTSTGGGVDLDIIRGGVVSSELNTLVGNAITDLLKKNRGFSGFDEDGNYILSKADEEQIYRSDDIYKEYRTKFYDECIKIVNIIDNKYSNSDRSKFIDPIKNSSEYIDFRWLVTTDDFKMVGKKEYETSNLLHDFVNLPIMKFFTEHNIVDFYMTYKNIFIKFFDFIDKSNAISTIGTIEYMDQIAKFNTVNTLGVLENNILPGDVGYVEMNVSIDNKNFVDKKLSGY